jgi:hypothetical protein
MGSVNAVEAGIDPWLARAQRTIRRWAPSPSAPDAPAAGAGAAHAPAAPIAGTDAPEAQAWFGAWIRAAASAERTPDADAPGAVGQETASHGAGSAGAVLGPSPRRPAAGSAGTGTARARSSRGPAWTAILDELMPRADAESRALPSSDARRPAAHAAAAPDAVPAGPRSRMGRPGAPAEVTSMVPPRGTVPGPGVPASPEAPRPQGAPAFEWMDEEDDLAGKLHRLLRRQAKRRGVDLS